MSHLSPSFAKIERDAYYLDRGIKPGPLAWYRIRPKWVRLVLLGLAIVLPMALVLFTVFSLTRG
jgi:hypothetical protein